MIEISVIFAGLGIALCSYLLVTAWRLDNLTPLSKFKKSNVRGMADLLIYASMVDNGVMANKDGSLSAAWIFQAPDQLSTPDLEREYSSAMINNAFKSLGSNWMLNVDAIRRKVDDYPGPEKSSFPDPVTKAIEEERRVYFEGLGARYESVFVLTITYKPLLLFETKLADLMFDDDTGKKTNQEIYQQILDKFNENCASFESKLNIAFKLERLRAIEIITEDGKTHYQDEFLRYLHFCIIGKNQPFILPQNPMYIDSLIGGEEMWIGVNPKIGNNFVHVVAFNGLPMESTPGMLNKLTLLPSEYRWSNRFIALDQHQAISELNKYHRKWKQKERGILAQIFNLPTSKVDLDAVAMVQDIDAAISEINTGLVSAGYYTSVVIIMDTDNERALRSVEIITTEVEALGFAPKVETINAVEAFLGSLPGHSVENIRRPIIHTLNLADFIPSSSVWTGQNFAPCPFYPPDSPPLLECATNGFTPFHLNLHVRDVGHTIIFGPTGAGKSVLLAAIAAQARRYKDMNIFAFDKDMSLYPLCQAVGGYHYEIGGDNDSLRFSPLQNLDTASDIAWAIEWISTILELNGVTVYPRMRNEIESTLLLLKEMPQHDRTITSFKVQNQIDAIKEAFVSYQENQAMGHFFDSEHDQLNIDFKNKFFVFEVEHLLNLSDKYKLPILLYLFRRIEKSLDGSPTLLILDEAWIMLGNETFRSKIREWFKVLRKANVAVVLATQSLSDAEQSGIIDVIAESTASKIFLPNRFAKNEDATALYTRFGLNLAQIDILSKAIAQRQYYYASEYGNRLFSLELGPLALSFVGASGKEDIARIKALEEKYGKFLWIPEWLRIRRLNPDYYGLDTETLQQQAR